MINVCYTYGWALDHHNALADAEACAMLYLECISEKELPVFEKNPFKKKKGNNPFRTQLSGEILKPDFENAYFSRGTAKMLAFKDYLGAVEDFTEVIKLSPNKEFAYYERGFAKFLLLNYEGAIEDFSKAIEINNDYALAYEYRGYVYEKLEDFESAAEDFFNAYMATDSDNPMSEVYLRASIKIKKELSEN